MMVHLRKPMVQFAAFLRQSHHVRQLSSASFKFSDLEVKAGTGSDLKPKPDPNKLVFGHQFADHMFEAEWTKADGWGVPKICPVHEIKLHPAAKVFHYAIELFEGMKAYRGEDNQIRLFRPDLNMKRMRASADRSTLPDFDGEELIKCIKKLVSVDQEWVPYSTTSTLYIRPTFIGTESNLGVTTTDRALLYVITGPVGPYFPTGFTPVSLLADPKYVRAWEGGSGNYKMGSNYAATIKVQTEAVQKHGCQQVLWLYGPDHQITEVGTMNFFMFWINENGEKELLTPPLDNGVILPGVTRQSLLDLARGWGDFKVTEKLFTMKDLVKGLKDGRVKEIFGAGTACVVCPVEKIIFNGEDLMIPTMSEDAPIAHRFLKELADIQFGRVESPWAPLVD